MTLGGAADGGAPGEDCAIAVCDHITNPQAASVGKAHQALHRPAMLLELALGGEIRGLVTIAVSGGISVELSKNQHCAGVAVPSNPPR